MGWLLGCSKVTATRAGAIPPVSTAKRCLGAEGSVLRGALTRGARGQAAP